MKITAKEIVIIVLAVIILIWGYTAGYKSKETTELEESTLCRAPEVPYVNEKYGYSLLLPIGMYIDEDNRDAIQIGAIDQHSLLNVLVFPKSKWREMLDDELNPFVYIAENENYVVTWEKAQDTTEEIRNINCFINYDGIIKSFKWVKHNNE